MARPSDLISLFETNAGEPNFAGSAKDVAQPPRHERGNNWAFGDGHVKWLKPKDVPLGMWRLDGVGADAPMRY